jgi:hypothetical protein
MPEIPLYRYKNVPSKDALAPLMGLPDTREEEKLRE